MAILIPPWLTTEALRVLEQTLRFVDRVNRVYDDGRGLP